MIIDGMSDADVPLGFGELQWLRCSWSPDGELSSASQDALLSALKRHLPGVEPLGAAIERLKQEVDQKLGAEFDVLERLGTGRMSVVFRARHRVHGDVALKVTPLAGILLLPGYYAELRGTIDAARELSHPNILAIRDVKLLETIACTVMDYVVGTTLAQCIASASPRMPLGRIKDIASDVADALAHAHLCGIVHASLSPSSIFVENAHDRALVSDFGMPNVGDGPEATAARALFLDVRYMSPEQCLGSPATTQSDQYSFGAVLYHMLTGKPPFVGKSAFAIMRGHCDDVATPIGEMRPECPPSVATAVMRMLAKKPRDRYLTTSMLAREVASWPLAESLPKGSPSLTPGSARAAKSALESYNRCLTDPNFLGEFYQRLRDDASIAPHLENMNFDRQVEVLKRAIRHFLEYAQGLENARVELERVAAFHQPFKLEVRQLRTFVDTLIELAMERDPNASEPNARESLHDDWHSATLIGLQRFAELAGAVECRVSA
ncbi:MAG TPA: serine/threonine-protein kinase, partial [Polyangiaceae bacterium]